MGTTRRDIERAGLLPKFVGYRDVQNAVGVSRRTIERMVRDGTFPRPQQLTPNRVGWKAEVVSDWLMMRTDKLLESAVANPNEMMDVEIDDALQALASHWLERRLGRPATDVNVTINVCENASEDAAIVDGALARLAEFDGCFEHFDVARAILAAAWLFPALRPLIEAGANPEAQAVFGDPQLLRTLGSLAMDDEAWLVHEADVERLLARPTS